MTLPLFVPGECVIADDRKATVRGVMLRAGERVYLLETQRGEVFMVPEKDVRAEEEQA